MTRHGRTARTSTSAGEPALLGEPPPPSSSIAVAERADAPPLPARAGGSRAELVGLAGGLRSASATTQRNRAHAATGAGAGLARDLPRQRLAGPLDPVGFRRAGLGMGTVGGVAGAPRPVHRGARRAAGVAGRPPVLPLAVRQSNARRLRPLPATQPDRDVRPAPPAADRTRRLRRVHRRRAEPGDPDGHRDRQGRARSRPRRRHRLRPGPPRQWSTGGRVAAGLPGAARHGRVDRSTGDAGAVAHPGQG